MDTIEQAADAIRSSSAILVTCGAGMGVDSGLPDFRGKEGFWRAYPAFKKIGKSFYDMANPIWFRNDPEQAWGFYGHRYLLYQSTTPHSGFEILLDWCRSKKEGYFVFTSNVDCHFQKAGFSVDRIVECHGSFSHLQCSIPCKQRIWDAHQLDIDIDESTMRANDPLPTCPFCDAVARPNILMFGDWDWVGDHGQRQMQRYADWIGSVSSGSLVVIEVGAGTAVPTVRHESETIANQKRSPLVRINVRESHGPGGTISIDQAGLSALQAINERI